MLMFLLFSCNRQGEWVETGVLHRVLMHDGIPAMHYDIRVSMRMLSPRSEAMPYLENSSAPVSTEQCFASIAQNNPRFLLSGTATNSFRYLGRDETPAVNLAHAPCNRSQEGQLGGVPSHASALGSPSSKEIAKFASRVARSAPLRSPPLGKVKWRLEWGFPCAMCLCHFFLLFFLLCSL